MTVIVQTTVIVIPPHLKSVATLFNHLYLVKRKCQETIDNLKEMYCTTINLNLIDLI